MRRPVPPVLTHRPNIATMRNIVTDPTASAVSDFRDLAFADRRPDRPGGRGLVIAEGAVVVERLLASNYPVRAVLGLARRLDSLDVPSQVPTYEVDASVMDQIVGFHLNRGVVATADRAPMPTIAELSARARVLLVLEGVNDHENLGAIFRSAAAFGVDGIILGPKCSDPLYRRAIRVSMGHVLKVPFVTAPSWPQTLYDLAIEGFQCWAMTPYPPAVQLRSLPTTEGKIAIVVGAEGSGLTDVALAAVPRHIRIPMAAGVDSLNVATAAAIALHHLAGMPSD